MTSGMDWQAVLALIAIGIAGLTLMSRLLDKSLTIREHEEYQRGAERQNDMLREQFLREIDGLGRQLLVLEQTRPTTGELKTTADFAKEQIAEIKNRLLKSGNGGSH